MEKIATAIANNYEWIFGGIGVAVIGLVISLFRKNDRGLTMMQKQKSGDNSLNMQIGQINKKGND